MNSASVLVALVRARGLTLDVGACRACAGSKHQVRWGQGGVDARESVRRPFLEEFGWRGAIVAVDQRNMSHIFWWRPCPECSEPGPDVECPTLGCEGGRFPASMNRTVTFEAYTKWVDCGDCKGKGRVPGPPQSTGRDIRDLAEVLLDALSETSVAGGDPLSRRALSVEADRLQDLGDPLGEWLALALVGKLDTVAAALAEAWGLARTWSPARREPDFLDLADAIVRARRRGNLTV